MLLSCLCLALSSAAWHFLWRHFELFQVCVNSCLIYKISIYGSDFKVHPLRIFLIGRCFVVRKRGGTNKNRSLFLSSDNPLQSRGCQKLNLQEHRWICSFLLTDGKKKMCSLHAEVRRLARCPLFLNETFWSDCQSSASRVISVLFSAFSSLSSGLCHHFLDFIGNLKKTTTASDVRC